MEPKKTLLLAALGGCCAMVLMLLHPLWIIPGFACLGALWAQAQKILKMSQTDPLTGVWNLRRLDQRRRYYVNQNSLVVLYFDLDHLKQVNDTQGHSAGDTLLRELAAALLQTAADQGEVYRIGGDEFLILAENVSGAELHHRWQKSEKAGCASCGWAEGRGNALDCLLRQAEQAMYRSRNG